MKTKTAAYIFLALVACAAVLGFVWLYSPAGFYTVPAAKEYGGAIKGISDPYARAFSGRAMEFPSGATAEYAAQYPGSAGVSTSGKAYGDYSGPRAVQQSATYKRSRPRTPSYLTTCQMMADLSGMPLYGQPAGTSEAASYAAMGRSCMPVTSMRSVAVEVRPNQWALAENLYEYAKSIGVSHCCTDASLIATRP